MFGVNHKQCPHCGNNLKHYYYRCGECGSFSITDWVKTFYLWIVALLLVVIVVFATLDYARTAVCPNQLLSSMFGGIFSCADFNGTNK